MVFDVRAAKLLNEGQALTIDGCAGLRLVATKSTKSWTYRYRTQAGSLKQAKLGSWPEMSFHEAMAAWGAARAARDGGADLALQRKEDRETIKRKQGLDRLPTDEYLVSALVRDFVQGHLYDARKEEGALAADRALRAFLDGNPALANMHAAELKRQHAFQALESIRHHPTKAQKLRSLMGAAWDYALDSGRLDGDAPNWWRSVMKGRLKSKGKLMQGSHQGQKRRVLSDDELGELLPWIVQNMHPVGRDACLLYLLAGVRGAEIFSMRTHHLAEKDGVLWWTIPKALTKNARMEHATDLRVPLLGMARELVCRRMANAKEDGVLFVDRMGKPYNQKDLSTYIYDLQPYSAKSKRAGLKREILPVTDWTPHNLRRTARTMLASLGCPKEVAEAIIGHLPPEIEATYNAYSYDAERLHWLQALGARLEVLGLPRLP